MAENVTDHRLARCAVSRPARSIAISTVDIRAILEKRLWQTVEEKSTLEASLAAAVPSRAPRSSSR